MLRLLKNTLNGSPNKMAFEKSGKTVKPKKVSMPLVVHVENNSIAIPNKDIVNMVKNHYSILIKKEKYNGILIGSSDLNITTNSHWVPFILVRF